jgi:hypothetical protein
MAFLHGPSSEAVREEACYYLDTLERTKRYEDSFSLSLVLLLPLPVSLYRDRANIFANIVRMPFLWLDRRSVLGALHFLSQSN